jgi:hypothetical protein
MNGFDKICDIALGKTRVEEVFVFKNMIDVFTSKVFDVYSNVLLIVVVDGGVIGYLSDMSWCWRSVGQMFRFTSFHVSTFIGGVMENSVTELACQAAFSGCIIIITCIFC